MWTPPLQFFVCAPHEGNMLARGYLIPPSYGRRQGDWLNPPPPRGVFFFDKVKMTRVPCPGPGGTLPNTSKKVNVVTSFSL